MDPAFFLLQRAVLGPASYRWGSGILQDQVAARQQAAIMNLQLREALARRMSPIREGFETGRYSQMYDKRLPYGITPEMVVTASAAGRTLANAENLDLEKLAFLPALRPLLARGIKPIAQAVRTRMPFLGRKAPIAPRTPAPTIPMRPPAPTAPMRPLAPTAIDAASGRTMLGMPAPKAPAPIGLLEPARTSVVTPGGTRLGMPPPSAPNAAYGAAKSTSRVAPQAPQAAVPPAPQPQASVKPQSTPQATAAKANAPAEAPPANAQAQSPQATTPQVADAQSANVGAAGVTSNAQGTQALGEKAKDIWDKAKKQLTPGRMLAAGALGGGMYGTYLLGKGALNYLDKEPLPVQRGNPYIQPAPSVNQWGQPLY